VQRCVHSVRELHQFHIFRLFGGKSGIAVTVWQICGRQKTGSADCRPLIVTSGSESARIWELLARSSPPRTPRRSAAVLAIGQKMPTLIKTTMMPPKTRRGHERERHLISHLWRGFASGVDTHRILTGFWGCIVNYSKIGSDPTVLNGSSRQLVYGVELATAFDSAATTLDVRRSTRTVALPELFATNMSPMTGSASIASLT
jgi:hypothetical protein